MDLKPGWKCERSYLDEFNHVGAEGWIFTSPDGRKFPVFGWWDSDEPVPPKECKCYEE